MQRRLRLVAAPLLAGALIATACGGSSDGGSDTGDTGGDTADSVADDTGDTVADDTGDTGGEDAGDTGDAEGDTGDAEGDTGDAEGDTGDAEPVDPSAVTRGGTLVALLEAESDTWDIPGANCAVACISVMNQVADTLTIVDENGAIQPFLLEAYEVSDDFTTHTLTMRDGVTFHDGTPADAAAVQRSLIEMASGILQGQVFLDLVNGSPVSADNPGDPADSIVLTDDKTVTVTFNKPFATFGQNIAGRTGWLIAPSFWDSETRASDLMIATGPFTMDEQVRDEVTRLSANPDYWRTDSAGEPLPYLDGIEFRPNPDGSARRAAMQSGDANVNQDSDGENKEFWEGEWVDGGNTIAPAAADQETGYLMLNNAKAPFDNPQIREALALCTDRDLYLQLRAPGNVKANGPFAEGAPGFMEDPGFPDFDAAAGNALLDEIGRPDVINYGTTNSPSNLLTAELFQKMWTDNCGLNVVIDQFDQSELITRAISGDFEVFAWRNHGQGNPGLELVWWHSRHAEGLALNFGRIIDPVVDELLFEAWSTTDRDELDRIGQEINQQFSANVNNIWLGFTDWNNGVAAGTNGVNTVTIDGETRVVGQYAGRLFLHEAWIG
ncbi:MAG: ABC transporter substrate-binding protein [Ilumatobacter sp.]|uniref:ABC transporter substrate-binding protein n=1 Tax=Ilumatobacter sp. TaxID=1967498 RepID=UPI00329A41D9